MRNAFVGLMLATIALVPSAVQADPVYVGQTLQVHSQNSPITGGGPFLVDLLDSVQDFLSFCLEASVPLGMDETLVIDKISTSAQGPGPADPISPRTAFWYSRYRAGDATFNGYYVQWMVWCEEGEAADCSALPTAAQNLRNATTNALMASYGWDPNSTGNVGVLTLKDLAGVDRQDVLFLIGAPEPGSLMLMGSGLVALATRLRRRRNA